jgi:hypothetical protein
MSSWISFLRPNVWAQIRNKGYSLQCHLDVNGVVLGQETIGNHLTPPQEYASLMLANGTYSQWMPDQQTKSYKAHVWENLHPGPNSDLALRKIRKEALRQFVTTLVTDKHALANQVNEQFKKLVANLQSSPIFRGLPHLIRTLKENKVPHNLIFRTFGGDGEFIKEYLAKEFPEIQLQEGKFDHNGSFHYQKESQDLIIQDYSEFRELIKKGHWLIQDNFERWLKGQEQGDFGKPFPFSSDPRDPVISIFADDNLEIVPSGQQRTIVCCYDATRKKFVSTKHAESRLIKVNPIEAALDPNYLTNRISQKAKQLIPKYHSQKIALITTLAVGLIAYILYAR